MAGSRACCGRVENAWDVDYLGQQGMWICTIVAVVSVGAAVLSGNSLIIAIGVLSGLFYLLGGMGVRQGNWPAAAMVLTVYVLGTLLDLAYHQMPNIFRILFTFVLLSNVRAAFLASEWKPAAEDEDRPTRFSETLADKYVDQMPARLWPVLQIPFLILGICMLLLTIVLIGLAMVSRLGLVPHQG